MRTATIALIIVVLVVLVVCIVCACVHVLCFNRISTWKERRKRQPVPGNLTPDEFACFADEFRNIFTEGQRELWDFSFVAAGTLHQMQWFSLDMHKVTDYEYSIKTTGQDAAGTWVSNGFYVNTNQGPVAWWFKDYDEDDYKSMRVYELIRSDLGDYTGLWYLRNKRRVQEQVLLQKRFGGQTNIEEKQINYEICSGSSEEVL